MAMSLDFEFTLERNFTDKIIGAWNLNASPLFTVMCKLPIASEVDLCTSGGLGEHSNINALRRRFPVFKKPIFRINPISLRIGMSVEKAKQ